MPASLVIAQGIIALLPTVEVGVEHLIGFINSVRTAAIQSGEWTPEMEAQYRAALWTKTGDPAYKLDAPQAS